MKKNLFLIFMLCSSSFAYTTKEKGLLWGSIYGDSFGGPYEFQTYEKHYLIKKNRRLTRREWRELSRSVRLKNYPSKKSAYGAWSDYAAKGTITDDTRHKVIFWSTYIKDPILTKRKLAKSYIDFYNRNTDYKEWLSEYVRSSYYIINPKHPLALPLARLWGGVPNLSGQMIFPLMAILQNNNYKKAYTETYKINFLDSGHALDFTSSIVAALSYCLTKKPTITELLDLMDKNDPFFYHQVPYVTRELSESIKLVNKLVSLSGGNPQKLFKLLETQLSAKTWWEADVAFVIVFAFLKISEKEPFAAFALAREFGHDVDSYSQLIGAFLGAIHGEELFDNSELNLVKNYMTKKHPNIFVGF